MRRIGSRILGAALGAWLLALFGCGRAPTAPPVDATTLPALVATRTDGGSLAVQVDDILEPGEPQGGGPDPSVAATPRAIGKDGLELQQPVVGKTGGMMRVADVKLLIPPGAFLGSADIKVTVPDTTRLECHLEIYPASKNDFAKPVRLEFDVRDGRDVRVMVVYWLDEATGAWVPLTTTVDRGSGKVWAELPHFSIYKADSEVQGRAGW